MFHELFLSTGLTRNVKPAIAFLGRQASRFKGQVFSRLALHWRIALSMLVLGFMSGCATQQRLGEFQVMEGVRFPADHVALIEDGVTRVEQVYELFGTPWRTESSPEGDTLKYWFVEAKTDETSGFMRGETDELRVERKLELKITEQGIVRAHDYFERKTRTLTSNRF